MVYVLATLVEGPANPAHPARQRLPMSAAKSRGNTSLNSVVDPFDTDPDSIDHPDADPDSDFYLMGSRMRIRSFI